MLRRLSVENYALIDRLEMELSPSLNIITGETGAGKSILLGALSLLLGARSEGNTAKDAAKSCVVEGTFDIAAYGLQKMFEQNDLDYDALTTIRRVISPGGKSRAYINDLPVQLTTLKEFATHLIDIHSQHQSLLIADDLFRINIVDSVAAHADSLQRYGELFVSLKTAEKELASLRAEAEQGRTEQEYLRFQLDQLSAMKLREGEQAELEQELNELSHAQEIGEVMTLAVDSLGEEERGVLIALKTIQHNLDKLGAVYPRSSELSLRIRTTFVELSDIEVELSREGERIESDPARLLFVEQRLKEIYDLQQKHRVSSVEQLLELESTFTRRLTQITDSDEAIAALRSKIESLYGAATKNSDRITAQRAKAAKQIESHVEGVLAELGVPNGRFVVDIQPLQSLSASGADAIRFLFSANRSMTPQAVEKIASGGEISRVMLALKAQVARSSQLPTIIFDEIDTGVSGRIADKMGEIISALGQSMQVINITHLPQVASKGKTHFVVFKEENSRTSTTHIRKLNSEERVDEIAKMLSGSTITDAALEQARLLLGR